MIEPEEKTCIEIDATPVNYITATKVKPSRIITKVNTTMPIVIERDIPQGGFVTLYCSLFFITSIFFILIMIIYVDGQL